MKKAILTVILLLATGLRFLGTAPGHNPYHPDEPMSYGSATDMFAYGDLNPRRYDYPAGVPILHYGFYKTFFLPFVYVKEFIFHPGTFLAVLERGQQFFQEQRARFFGPRDLYALFWSRMITALLGVGSVYLTYLIGKKLFGEVAGLASSFVVAVNYRHNLSSHLALSDIPNGFFALLAFYASLVLLEQNSRRRYLFAAVSVGLSIAMKYQLFALLPFLLAHLVWTVREKRPGAFINKNFLLSLLVIGSVFAVLNPYLLLNLKEALPVIRYVSLRYGAGVMRFNVYPLVYLYYWGMGQWVTLAITAGFLLAIVLRLPAALFLLSFVGPFLFVFLYYMSGGVYVRNFTTVIPFLALFAGFGVRQVYRMFRKSIPYAGLAVTVLFLFVNAGPLQDSTAVSRFYLKPWNREVVSTWAAEKLPTKSRVLNANLGLPSSLENRLTLIPWEHKELNSITQMVRQGFNFAVLNTSWYQIYLFWFDRPLGEVLAARGIPYRTLEESYYGLAMREFLNYVVYEVYKPWQAPDDNYVVIKLPKFSNGGRLVTTRDFTDVPFSVPPGRFYRVEAFVKPGQEILANQKDGFLRLESGNRVAVSERVFGLPEWTKIDAVIFVPLSDSNLTVRFSRSRPELDFPYELGRLSLYELPVAPDPYPQLPYITPTIGKDTLYPNSIY